MISGDSQSQKWGMQKKHLCVCVGGGYHGKLRYLFAGGKYKDERKVFAPKAKFYPKLYPKKRGGMTLFLVFVCAKFSVFKMRYHDFLVFC